MTAPDKFTSYADAMTWLHSIGGLVGPAERLADDIDGFMVYGSHGLSQQGGFQTGLRGTPYRMAHEEGVRIACSELYKRGVEQGLW